jgi:hypothetical protein
MGLRSPFSRSRSGSAGVTDYLKHAFLYHWNLLLFFGGAGLAALSPWPDALMPIVGALELSYLTGLLATPRFRTAIDAKLAQAKGGRGAQAKADAAAEQSLQRLVESLPADGRSRFVALRQRCVEMRDIAYGVRGHAADAPDSAESIRTPALDRLLFLFLRLLVSQQGLERFLKSTTEQDLVSRLEDTKQRLTAAQAGSDERVTRSLQDSAADGELRLDNYRKSRKDAEFVAIELDRIETKIHALTEMAVSRQDPDDLSHQVTAAAESMQQTEDAVNRLQHLTGLADEMAEPPPILESDLSRIGVHDR